MSYAGLTTEQDITVGFDQTRPIPRAVPRRGAHRRRSGVGRGARLAAVAVVAAGLLVAFAIGISVGVANQPAPTAQPAPGVITRTVTEPGSGAPVTVASAAAATETPGTFATGKYRVGTDIKPGNYRTTGSDGCYWARLASDDGAFGSIITNDLFSGPASMTVKASDQYVEFAGPCTWTKK